MGEDVDWLISYTENLRGALDRILRLKVAQSHTYQDEGCRSMLNYCQSIARNALVIEEEEERNES